MSSIRDIPFWANLHEASLLRFSGLTVLSFATESTGGGGSSPDMLQDDDDDDDNEGGKDFPPKPPLTSIPDMAIDFATLVDDAELGDVLRTELIKLVRETLNVQDESVTYRRLLNRHRAAGWTEPLSADPQARAEQLAARERGFRGLRRLDPGDNAITFGVWLSAEMIRREAYVAWNQQQKHIDVREPMHWGGFVTIVTTGSVDLKDFGPIDFEPPDGIAVTLKGYAELFLGQWFPILASNFCVRNKERLTAENTLAYSTYDSTYPNLSFTIPTIPEISGPIRDRLRSELSICRRLVDRARLNPVHFKWNGQRKLLVLRYHGRDIAVWTNGVVLGGSGQLRDAPPLNPTARIVGPGQLWAQEDDLQLSQIYVLQTNDLTPPLTVKWSSSGAIVLNHPVTLVEVQFDVSQLQPGKRISHWIDAEVTKDANNTSAKAPRKLITVSRRR